MSEEEDIQSTRQNEMPNSVWICSQKMACSFNRVFPWGLRIVEVPNS